MVKYISLNGLSHTAIMRGLGFVIRHVSYSSFDTCIKKQNKNIFIKFENDFFINENIAMDH